MKKKIIIISIITVVLLGIGSYFVFFRAKGKPVIFINKNNNKVNEEDKTKMYKIIGLTDKGYKRTTKEECAGCDEDKGNKLESGKYVLYNDYSLANFFITLEDNKEIIIKDLPKEKIKELIYLYADEADIVNYDVLIEDEATPNIESYSCLEGTGFCNGIEATDYIKVSEAYALSDNPDSYFAETEKYGEYYLFDDNSVNPIFAEIDDDIKAESNNDDAVVVYNIKAKFNAADHQDINKSIKYTFKKDENNEYYLYSVFIKK